MAAITTSIVGATANWTGIDILYAPTTSRVVLPLPRISNQEVAILIPAVTSGVTNTVPLLLPPAAESVPLAVLGEGLVQLPVLSGITIAFSVPTSPPNAASSVKPVDPKVYFQVAAPTASASSSVSPVVSATSIAPTLPSSSVSTNDTLAPASATPSTPVVVKQTGLPDGAAAGLAIGCLVAGALIAGVVLWFCWRKRKAAGVRDHEASRMALMPAHEKGFAANTVPLGSGSSAASPVSAALPLPLEDKAITGEISKIANSIKNHVQSYYQNGRVSSGLIDVDDIHALGNGQPISAGTLSTLLGNTATREIALRFCIAWAVCSRMRPGADSKTSLLPQEVAGCVQSITPQKGGSSAQNSAALARWRVMTAELSQASYVRQPFTNADSRNANIQATLAALENILQPFADSRMDNGERKRNLEEILKRSALFAFTLFSQPSTWDFDWCEKQGVKSGELCIFPALVQLSDEHGQAVSPPRPFSEAVIRRLSE